MGTRRAKTKASGVSKEAKLEAKKKRNLIIMGSALIALMVFSAFGVMLYKDDNNGNGNPLQKDWMGFELKYNILEDDISYWEILDADSSKEHYIGMQFYTFIDSLPDYYNGTNKAEVMAALRKDAIYASVDLTELVDSGFEMNNTVNVTEEQVTSVYMVQGQEMAIAKMSDLYMREQKLLMKTGNVEYQGFGAPISCANATDVMTVLSYQVGNETKIIMEDNCVILQAVEPIDFVKITEFIQYELIAEE